MAHTKNFTSCRKGPPDIRYTHIQERVCLWIYIHTDVRRQIYTYMNLLQLLLAAGAALCWWRTQNVERGRQTSDIHLYEPAAAPCCGISSLLVAHTKNFTSCRKGPPDVRYTHIQESFSSRLYEPAAAPCCGGSSLLVAHTKNFTSCRKGPPDVRYTHIQERVCLCNFPCSAEQCVYILYYVLRILQRVTGRGLADLYL